MIQLFGFDENGNWIMANVVTFQPGCYRFIEHAFQYSGGVAAEPGFAIERATGLTSSRKIPHLSSRST